MERTWRVARWAAVAICAIASLVPLFVARDVPLVDLPAHLGAVDIWNRYDDPSLGYATYYTRHIVPAPYFLVYGFIHLFSYVLPIRVAAKVFIALSIIGLPIALSAWIRAHRGPAVLALAAFPIAWSMNQTWGFLAFTSGTAILLYAYSLLARFEDATPSPSRALWAAAAGMGPVLLLAHPLLSLLWFAAIPVYARRRAVTWALALPTLVVLAIALGGGPPRVHIDGVWRSVRENVTNLFLTQVVGIWSLRWHVLIALACALLAAFVLAGRRLAPADRRPLVMFAILTAIYFILPLHLNQPLIFAGMNVRVEVIVALAAFVLVDNRVLSPRRELIVALPLLFATFIMAASVTTRYAAFGAKENDFYETIQTLPTNPKLIVLVFEPKEPSLGQPVWGKFAAYVRLERGGFDTTLWNDSNGIGTLAFPAGYRPGSGRPMPSPDTPQQFNYATDGSAYDYFLTKSEPPSLFEHRPELTRVAEHGAWRLWQRHSF